MCFNAPLRILYLLQHAPHRKGRSVMRGEYTPPHPKGPGAGLPLRDTSKKLSTKEFSRGTSRYAQPTEGLQMRSAPAITSTARWGCMPWSLGRVFRC